MDIPTIPPPNEMESVIATAQKAVKPAPLDLERVYALNVPAGDDIRVVSLEAHAPAPFRKKGTVTLFDAVSFSTYVNRHKSGATVLYRRDIDKCILIGVLDDHSVESPGWGQHTAELSMQTTPAWQKWRGSNNMFLTQEEFAEFIEDRLDDIVEPKGADLLELAQTFQAKTKVEFKQGRQLSTGERQLIYTEDVDAKGGQKGELTIPKQFTLGIAPFEGGDSYKVIARLRYRLREGSLTLGFVLNNPKDVEKAAFADVVSKVEELTELTTLYGINH